MEEISGTVLLRHNFRSNIYKLADIQRQIDSHIVTCTIGDARIRQDYDLVRNWYLRILKIKTEDIPKLMRTTAWSNLEGHWVEPIIDERQESYESEAMEEDSSDDKDVNPPAMPASLSESMRAELKESDKQIMDMLGFTTRAELEACMHANYGPYGRSSQASSSKASHENSDGSKDGAYDAEGLLVEDVDGDIEMTDTTPASPSTISNDPSPVTVQDALRNNSNNTLSGSDAATEPLPELLSSGAQSWADEVESELEEASSARAKSASYPGGSTSPDDELSVARYPIRLESTSNSGNTSHGAGEDRKINKREAEEELEELEERGRSTRRRSSSRRDKGAATGGEKRGNGLAQDTKGFQHGLESNLPSPPLLRPDVEADNDHHDPVLDAWREGEDIFYWQLEGVFLAQFARRAFKEDFMDARRAYLADAFQSRQPREPSELPVPGRKATEAASPLRKEYTGE